MTQHKLAVLPTSGIGQDEIEMLISLDNQLLTLQRQRDNLASDLLARRMAGVRVESGMYHLEVVTEKNAGRRVHRIVIS